MTHRKEQVNEVLNPGCTRVTPKLNIDQLDSDLTNNLSNNLDQTSLASRANKIYDVKITKYNTNVKGGLTFTIPASVLYCRRVNEPIFPFKRLY